MKLISCYIEKFGGLSQYALDFNSGVTVLEEPNGFGKTTLAEFLRAMFYGFPRKAKTLDKSKRQKYTPWDGGKFGGNLVFELDGTRYRLERTFGATPRSDSFQVIDLTTGRKTDRFTEEIGQELFQLDADSFERSTYLPQNQEGLSLTTAGIQAKLTDLVEDTNDLGNYDKAIVALKTARSAFVPYRGNGGSVAEAAGRVSALQQELRQIQWEKEELNRIREELTRKESLGQNCEAELGILRRQIHAAAEAAARQAKREHLSVMESSRAAEEAAVAELQTRYPGGIPSEETIDDARKIVDDLVALNAQEVTTPADLEAEELLKALTPNFTDGVPTAQELEQAEKQWDISKTLQAEWRNTGLTESEEEQFATLHTLFRGNPPTEEKLDALAEQSRRLTVCRGARAGLTVAEEDRARMRQLSSIFAPGIPEESEIAGQEETLAKCRTMALENPIPEQEKTGILPVILAVVLAVAGIVLLVLSQYIYGAAALVLGITLSVAVLLQRRKAARNREQLLKEWEAQIRTMTEQVDAFVHIYIPDASGEVGLREIRQDLAQYRMLAEKLRQLREKRAALDEQITGLETELADELGLKADQAEFDRNITNLRLARSQYLSLTEKRRNGEKKRRELQEEIQRIHTCLSEFLVPYGIEAAGEQLGAGIGQLKRNVDNYLRAKAQAEYHQRNREEHEAKIARCQDKLDAFLAPFVMLGTQDVRQQLQQLRDDGRALKNHTREQSLLENRIGQFLLENPDIQLEETEALPDTEGLKIREKQLTEELYRLNREVSRQEQDLRILQARIDRLPQIQDDLEFWQEKRIGDQKKSDTLDATMDFLAEARERLTTSYLGPIRESFTRYMEKLTKLTGETFFITPELDVQLERQGHARELGYFSAGQTDAVMLCMRLALVDALFEGEKPFVILDDPFVNLDDERTAQALNLLKELGREQQIIYLTCNSSRSM